MPSNSSAAIISFFDTISTGVLAYRHGIEILTHLAPVSYTHLRRYTHLTFDDLKKMRVSMKRAKYFITAEGKSYGNIWLRQELITPMLLSEKGAAGFGQVSLFDDEVTGEDRIKCLTGEM